LGSWGKFQEAASARWKNASIVEGGRRVFVHWREAARSWERKGERLAWTWQQVLERLERSVRSRCVAIDRAALGK
jgi:hypothetical protein